MNQQADVYLSVVTAAYNEAENIANLVEQIASALSKIEGKSEIVVVNDGSSDDTLQIAQKLMKQYPALRVINLAHRSGQTAAIDAGFHYAQGEYIAMLDADLQNDPADIPRMLELLVAERCDLVNGWRKDRQDPLMRKISTKIANGVRNKLTHETIHDSACGLKVFRRKCLSQIKLYTGMHRFLPTLFRIENFKVIEIPVNHRPRIAGKAKYGVMNRVFKALRDTFAIRWMQSRIFHYQAKEIEP